VSRGRKYANKNEQWRLWKRGYSQFWFNGFEHRADPTEPPPLEVLRERDRAFSAPRTLSQIFLGDPLWGRSALDKLRAAI
jgi:hypothetical protein